MRPLIVLACLSALAPATAHADYSPCPSTDWGVSTLALEVEQAYIAAQGGELYDSLEGLRAAVSCLDEAITPETAAAVHRSFAFAAVWDQDESAATRALKAALIAEPGWEPQLELAPPGGDLFMTIEWVRAERDPTRTTLTAPPGLALRLDGAATWRRAERLPVVLQLIDGEGRPLRTAYVVPGAPLPAGVHAGPGGEERRAPSMRVSSPSRKTRVLLLSGAGVLAVGAVGLGVASADVRSDWQAAVDTCEARVEGCSPRATRYNELDDRLAKRLGLGAGIAAAGSAALGVGVVLTW